MVFNGLFTLIKHKVIKHRKFYVFLFNEKDDNMKYMTFFIIIINMLFAQYNYSEQDMNPTSDSYGEMVWEPVYNGFITLHYFTTQG